MARPAIHCAWASCTQTDILSVAHLRVKLSNPDQPWRDVRVCNAMCLAEWLDDELDPQPGYEPTVFTTEVWISGRADADPQDADPAGTGG